MIRRHTLCGLNRHYSDVIMNPMASQITGVPLVCTTVCSGTDQRKHQSSASLAFVSGIHWWPVDSPHKGPVTRIFFPFDDVIMTCNKTIKLKQFDMHLITPASDITQPNDNFHWCVFQACDRVTALNLTCLVGRRKDSTLGHWSTKYPSQTEILRWEYTSTGIINIYFIWYRRFHRTYKSSVI